MSPLRYIPHYTYDDYKLWEGDWELISGIPYAISPPPVQKHQSLESKLIVAISNALTRKKKDGGVCSVYHGLDWIVSNDTILTPDIMIVCKSFTTQFLTVAPDLIIEILSPGTAIKDRTAKFDIYESQKVKYYIIADPDALKYKIFEIGNNGYVETTSENFLLNKNCSLKLDLASILQSIK